ncbi:RNase adapter RapZ [Niveibacterium sp. 24ML]|uniref:RNase adapter RapZ n=1 Tax=Niveibacterium sp. 24ML TaxID=2985512 RepID=UPI00226E2856|nr:RNase adapter RapZ [Niveibacterium sp. 24ML]MCX9155790.1 RNase adapter RapZ [Niveibacterium sp. 24ML]
MQLILISGLSGSGKSIALAVLEDAGYYCVDNLPAPLLPQLVDTLGAAGYSRVGVAVDVRGGESLQALPETVEALRDKVADVRFVFLEARNTTLIARFSETRRRHPLASDGVTLLEAIERERDALEAVGELGQRIDTSDLHPNTLRTWLKDLIQIAPAHGLTLLVESFGFKHGIPLDADLVFDVRCLPNPFYDPALRPLTGRDQPVIDFLCAHDDVSRMVGDISTWLANWLPSYMRDSRAYLTLAIGCTGGQHRSVYIAETIAARFRDQVRVLVRHRALKS